MSYNRGFQEQCKINLHQKSASLQNSKTKTTHKEAMKLIHLIIISLLTFSCSNKNGITEFENILGKENSKTLTYLVNDFEYNFIKRPISNF